MKLNRKWLMVIALVLSMAMATGGTLAYLTDRDTAENTFTMGNVDIELIEDFPEKGAPIKPGETVNKDAKIENKGSNDAWVWMTVSVDEKLKDFVTLNWHTGFTPTASSPTFKDGQAVWTVLVNDALSPNTSTDFILDSVTLSGTVDFQDGKYVIVNKGSTADLEGLDVNKLNVTVNGYAVQKEGFDSVENARKAYQQQWNDYSSEIVESGTAGGIRWTLTDTGLLTVAPSTETKTDKNCGKEFEPGAWREAVVYNNKGAGIAIGSKKGDADAGYFFCDPAAVKSLVIEDGVTSIGSFAAKFPNLTGEVVIPASVTYIGQEAFQNTPITKLTFAAGGTAPLCIAPGAFKNLQIEELVLPADRPEIHIHCWAFLGCKKLEHVTLPKNIKTFSGWTHVEYTGMNYANGTDSQIFDDCFALKSITFGSQDVRDRFFNAPGNSGNINAIGNVAIKIEN